MKRKKRAKKIKHHHLFIKSFKGLDKRIIHVIMFDALFYLALFGLLIFTFNSLSWNFEAVKEAIPTLTNVIGEMEEIEAVATPQELTELSNLFFMVISKTILILLIVFILSFMVGIFFKGLIWTKILHKKFDIHYYRRFALLNLFWIAPWSILIVLLLYAIKSAVVLWYIIGIMIIFIHFTNIIYVIFEKEKKFSRILKETFIFGIEKIPYFILPYIVVTSIFVILLFILSLFTFLPLNMHIIFSVLVLLAYFAWVRIYLSRIVLHLL